MYLGYFFFEAVEKRTERGKCKSLTKRNTIIYFYTAKVIKTRK